MYESREKQGVGDTERDVESGNGARKNIKNPQKLRAIMVVEAENVAGEPALVCYSSPHIRRCRGWSDTVWIALRAQGGRGCCAIRSAPSDLSSAGTHIYTSRFKRSLYGRMLVSKRNN